MAVRRRPRRPGICACRASEVFRHAVDQHFRRDRDSRSRRPNVAAADIDWFVPHQANQRILDGTARKLGVAPGTVVSTVAQHGNTSAASVPLALAAAVNDGRIKRERSGAAGGDGRRLHLGRRADPLVATAYLSL